MILSVIIPTYNRGARLLPTLRDLLANDTTGFGEVEILIVDDGSHPAVSEIVDPGVPAPFTLRVLRQENRGAGPARNAGFRVARGEILLFMDDDILAPQDLLQQHVAAHRMRPGSVIVGLYPVIAPQHWTPLYDFVNKLQGDPSDLRETFTPWLIASGNASFEAAMLNGWPALYTELPGGDDAEITSRFRRLGIPVLLASSIRARQDQPVTLRAQVDRSFHHAVGIGIVASRNPEDPVFGFAISANGSIRRTDSIPRKVKKALFTALSPKLIRNILLRVGEALDQDFVPDVLRVAAYRSLLNINYFAGVRRGLGFKAEATSVEESATPLDPVEDGENVDG